MVGGMPMMFERLVMATVDKAVSIAKESAAADAVLSEQAAGMVGWYFANEGMARRSKRSVPVAARVGFDEPREEGRQNVPWFAR
jgi:hypothetical protein